MYREDFKQVKRNRSVGECLGYFITRVCLFLAMSMVSVVYGKILPPIIWSSSNPLFQSDSNIIQIHLSDTLVIDCPNYDVKGVTLANLEYYAIYRVTKADYDACEIKKDNRKELVVNFSTPLSKRRAMITVETFSTDPEHLEFQPGRTYYFITTSTGTLDGLNNQVHGACRHKNMKVKMEVCCSSTTQTPTPAVNLPGGKHP